MLTLLLLILFTGSFLGWYKLQKKDSLLHIPRHDGLKNVLEDIARQLPAICGQDFPRWLQTVPGLCLFVTSNTWDLAGCNNKVGYFVPKPPTTIGQ